MDISTLFSTPWSYLPSWIKLLAACVTDILMGALLCVVPTIRLTLVIRPSASVV